MIKLLLVGLGGFVGAVARYGVSLFFGRRSPSVFPYGTMTANFVGCFAIGVCMHLVVDHKMIGPNMRHFGMIGLLGAFTTFSTFGYETLEMLHEGSTGMALGNMAVNVVGGLGAVWLGLAVGRLDRAVTMKGRHAHEDRGRSAVAAGLRG